MAIYFDSTAHPQLFNLRSPGVQMLVDLAVHRGQRLAVSEIAFQEIERHTRVQIRRDARALHRARRDLDDRWCVRIPDDTFNPDATLADWRKRFQDIFGDPVAVDGPHAREALLREIQGERPATRDPDQNDRAKGARDTAIWLSCVRHHAGENAEGFFVSADSAFFKTRGSDELHPDLQRDVVGLEYPLRLVRGTKDLAPTLGRQLTPDHAARVRDECLPLIAEALRVFLKEKGDDARKRQTMEWTRPAPDVYEVAGGVVFAGTLVAAGDPRLRVAVNLIRPAEGAWSVFVSAADPLINRVSGVEL